MDLWLPDSIQMHKGRLNVDPDITRQLSGQQLTTAEILYTLPDYPMLLQTYVWQDYDWSPRFPALRRFITFWKRDIEGRLHYITVSVRDALGDVAFKFYADEFET